MVVLKTKGEKDMKDDSTINRRLKEAGAPDDLIAQYQRYADSGNKQGQERVLCRCRRIKNDTLIEDREKLACLDYIIARVEKTHTLLEAVDHPNGGTGESL